MKKGATNTQVTNIVNFSDNALTTPMTIDEKTPNTINKTFERLVKKPTPITLLLIMLILG